MRLNGRRAILVYLGYSPRNHRAWPKVRARYGEVILRDRETGRVWAMAEQLYAVDIRRSTPLSTTVLEPPRRRQV